MTYNSVKHKPRLIFFHPGPHGLLRLRFHRCIDEQSWFSGFLPQDFQGFIVVGIFID